MRGIFTRGLYTSIRQYRLGKLSFGNSCSIRTHVRKPSGHFARHTQASPRPFHERHGLGCCDKRIKEDYVHFCTSMCKWTSCSVLYFSRATREVMVTMTLDAMKNRLYRTVWHRSDASLRDHSSVSFPEYSISVFPPGTLSVHWFTPL